MKQNLHTHSIFCDGKDTIEEMTLEAISKGFDILGFSGHGYLSIEWIFIGSVDNILLKLVDSLLLGLTVNVG